MKKLLIALWYNLIELPSYLEYLFDKPDDPGCISDNNFIDWFERLKCRIKHHPCGSYYYNPGGWEPDYHCKNCGDLLG